MSTDRVVIGVDFSAAVQRAAPWVSAHIAPGSEFVLVHAVEHADVPGFLRPLVSDADERKARDFAAAEQRLGEWRASVGLAEARLAVREGRASDVLRSAAKEYDARLTVIGAHGGQERPWLRLGTTAERLLRSAESSVLVVRGPMAGAPQRILVALDDADITERLLSEAGALADRFSARLHAVHVVSNAAYSHVSSAEVLESKSDEEARARVEADMAAEALRWVRALWHHTTKHANLEVEVPHGNAGDEILAAAERLEADLIVIGRYGAGRIVPAILGSVVGSVVHGARCPVLVIAD